MRDVSCLVQVTYTSRTVKKSGISSPEYIYFFVFFREPAEITSRCMRIPAGRLLKCGVFILGRFGMLVKGEEAPAGVALTLGIRSAL